MDNKNISGNEPFEINIRAVYGMRSIGGGHAALEKFCGFLDMPAPMTKNNYDKVSKNLKEAAKTVAERTMSEAAKELGGGGDSPINVGVSVHGSW